MQTAPKHSAFAPRRFAAPDPRADGHRRVVRLDGENVVIARVVAGVFMNVTVATSAYRGVMLRIAGAREDGFSYEIRLVHADPDLCVVLAEANDDWDVHAEWRLWARVLGLPALVERVEGRDEPDRPMLGKVAVRRPCAAAARQDDHRAARALPDPPQGRAAGALRAGRQRARANCSAARSRNAERPCARPTRAVCAPGRRANNPLYRSFRGTLRPDQRRLSLVAPIGSR